MGLYIFLVLSLQKLYIFNIIPFSDNVFWWRFFVIIFLTILTIF